MYSDFYTMASVFKTLLKYSVSLIATFVLKCLEALEGFAFNPLDYSSNGCGKGTNTGLIGIQR